MAEGMPVIPSEQCALHHRNDSTAKDRKAYISILPQAITSRPNLSVLMRNGISRMVRNWIKRLKIEENERATTTETLPVACLRLSIP